MATLNPNPAEELLPQDLSQAAETTVPDAPAPSLYTITQADINSNLNLQKQGVMSGDQIDESTGQLVRNYSSPEDAVEDLQFITEEDIMNAPDLADVHGASAGDVIADGKLIKTGSSDFFKNLAYAWDTTSSYEELIAKYQAGEGYLGGDLQLMHLSGAGVKQSPEEFYGEGFGDAPPEQRRQMINRKMERMVAEKYGRFFRPEQWSAGQIVGTMGKVLSDPMSYVGGAVKGAPILGQGAIEAGVGVGYSMAEDLTTDSAEINPEKAALYGTLGFGGTVLPVVTVRGVKNMRDKSANKLVDDAQQTINDHIKAGGTPQAAAQLAADLHGAKKLNAAYMRTGRMPKIGNNAPEAQRYLDELIQKDPLGAKSKFPTLRKAFGMMRTEILMRSPAIARRLDVYDRNTGLFAEGYLQRGREFIKNFRKLSKAQRRQVTKLMYNGDFQGAQALLPANMRGKMFNDFTKIYDEIGDDLLAAGHTFKKEKNYVHRGIKDYDQLVKLMGKGHRDDLTKALEGYAKKHKISVSNIPSDVRERMANQIIRGRRWDPATSSLAQTKTRSIDVIDDKLMDAYDDLGDSFERYVRTSVHDIEKRKFFGRHAQQQQGQVHIEDSVGKLMDDYVQRGLVKQGTERELIDMINSRFGKGEQAMNPFMQGAKNIGYMGTIANMVSSVLQLADAGISVVENGLRNSVRGMFDATVGGVTGSRNIKMLELGLKDASNDIVSSRGKTQRLLDELFKWSGFARLDRFGKETIVNAGFRKNMKQVMTPKGEAAFRKKWGQYYGDEINDIVNEFKALNRNPNFKPSDVPDSIRAHMFAELADVQPIGRSNIPQAYLDSPNIGRTLYMLKTWTLKQYDIMRRRIVHEWKRGNKREAAKYAAAYGLTLSLANGGVNMVRNMMQGRDVRPEDLPNEMLIGLLGVFGLNKYGWDRYLSEGDIGGFVMSQVTPPTNIPEEIGEAFVDAVDPDSELKSFAEYARPLPIVGPMLYGWFGGGKERWNERQDR